jgi:diguanylate cyclase (GGDEF)-like protein
VNWQQYKYSLALAGMVLGLAVPVVCVYLSSLWDVDGFAYLSFLIPISFMGFGYLIGHLVDKLLAQKSQFTQSSSSLREQSIIDELTGQYNRRHILLELDKELERARRYKHTLGGIMIDVDDFKKFNDRHGHLFGDYVLKEVTQVFDHCIRTIDVLGRYGGDEFMILLPEATPETATIVAERIKKTMHEHPFVHKKRPFKVTCSIGVHYFHDLTNVDKADFIDQIDKALYKAKSAGKDRVVTK